MKYPVRFWEETIPRLTDVSVAALLHALADAPDHLPRGVVRSSAAVWSATRYAWAAEHITAEIAIAAGVTVDQRVELACIWELATAEVPPGPRAAVWWGQRIAQTQASFAPDLYRKMMAMMGPGSQAGFEQGYRSTGEKVPRGRKVAPRPRADDFEPLLASVKKLEAELRAELGAEPLGDTPSAADRRSFVNVLAAGYEAEYLMDALAGRAEKCRKAPRWRDIDTADTFLRITWLCGDLKRLQEAERVGAMLKQEPESPIIVGKDGRRYTHGMEIFEGAEPAVNPEAAKLVYENLPPNRWIKGQ